MGFPTPELRQVVPRKQLLQCEEGAACAVGAAPLSSFTSETKRVTAVRWRWEKIELSAAGLTAAVVKRPPPALHTRVYLIIIQRAMEN